MKELHIGDAAPNFTATAVGGKYGSGTPVSLDEFQGKTVILYFYPRDNTPGCTTQACGLRDAWSQFETSATLFGVSIDSSESHAQFIEAFKLPFPLLSDESKKIVEDYGVWIEKNRDGKKSMGTERATFVIGPDQKITAIFHNVNPTEHVDQLLGAIKG